MQAIAKYIKSKLTKDEDIYFTDLSKALRNNGIVESEGLNEADDKWSDDVKTKWTPPAGLFTEPANKIADVLHKESDDLDQAIEEAS